ncbi:MAG: DNA-3-methyladenine glycosylase I [Hyphomicrobiaceae bacterium]
MARRTSTREIARCPWPGIDDPAYQRYHDEEWGVPLGDDRALFEKMALEGFQSGLSWLTILRKRENFRAAFHGFDPQRIARYGARDVARLMDDAGIVRNRAKIEATIGNARAYLELAEGEGLAALLWGIAGEDRVATDAPASLREVPPQTAASRRMSRELKRRGFRFVGPTTMYALMQSAGMVNDHLATCHRRRPCGDLQRRFQQSTRRGGR